MEQMTFSDSDDDEVEEEQNPHGKSKSDFLNF